MPSLCQITRLIAAPSRERLLRRSLAGLLFVVSFAVYIGCLSNEFVMDDYLHILSNPWIKNPKYLPEIFSSSLWSHGGGNTSLYRPLIHVLFMGTYHLFGDDPTGFHLLNLLLHAGATVFFFLLAVEILGRQAAASPRETMFGAFAASMLFATHPIHCESVAWVSGVMDLACAFFFLCSLFLYARSEGAAGWKYWLSIGAFFLATLCKEPALLLAPIFACYDWASSANANQWRQRMPRYLPLLLVVATYSLMRVHALGGVAPVTHGHDLTAYEYVLNGCILFSRYLAMMLFPVGLNVWHVFEPATSIATRAGMFGIAAAVAFAGCSWFLARHSKAAFLGLLLFLLPLLPALYIPGLTQGIENAFAERYLYLSSIGIALVVGVFVCWMLRRRGRWHAIAAVMIMAVATSYSIGTVRRVAVWKDSYTLWSDAVEKSPQSGTTHVGLGDAYRDQDRIDEAIEQYRIGIALMPNSASAHADLGMLYTRKGWIDEGIEQLQTALALEPENTVARNYLGVVFGKLGRHDEAIAQLQLAIVAHPKFQLAHRHLGIAYYESGRVRESIAPFERAIELDPDDADAHNNLAVSFAVLGNWERALTHFERAMELDPENPAPRANLEMARKRASKQPAD